MLAEAQLRDILARPDLDRTNKLLACLAVDAKTPKKVKAVMALAESHGLRSIRKWNVSSHLSRSKGLASRVTDGWVLTAAGRKRIAYLGLAGAALITRTSAALRKHSAILKNSDTRYFVDEAIACFEAQLYRAAVVFSWVGAVSLLYDHVIAKCLSAFNAEAARRNPKYRHARTRDDLARLREADFLDCLEGASIIGKSVRKELGVCLDVRNGCGHPNGLKIGETRVAAHIESLILNVYASF